MAGTGAFSLPSLELYFPLGLKLPPPPADNPFKTFIKGEMLDKRTANRLLIFKRKVIPANKHPSNHSGDTA
jgi:hypothetical protein